MDGKRKKMLEIIFKAREEKLASISLKYIILIEVQDAIV